MTIEYLTLLDVLVQVTPKSAPPAVTPVHCLPDTVRVVLAGQQGSSAGSVQLAIAGLTALAALVLPFWQWKIAIKNIAAQAELAKDQMTSQSALAKEQMAAQATASAQQLEAQAVIAQKQIDATVRSANRMKWVEQLRGAIVEFLTSHAMAIVALEEKDIGVAEVYSRMEAVTRHAYQVRMSLTPGDPEHDQLGIAVARALKDITSRNQANDVIRANRKEVEDLTRHLLKEAWEAAKRLE